MAVRLIGGILVHVVAILVVPPVRCGGHPIRAHRRRRRTRGTYPGDSRDRYTLSRDIGSMESATSPVRGRVPPLTTGADVHNLAHGGS